MSAVMGIWTRELAKLRHSLQVTPSLPAAASHPSTSVVKQDTTASPASAKNQAAKVEPLQEMLPESTLCLLMNRFSQPHPSNSLQITSASQPQPAASAKTQAAKVEPLQDTLTESTLCLLMDRFTPW